MLATAAVVCLALVFSLGVAATVFPGFEWFLQRMGQDLRGRVQPVELNSSSQGITMEVLAAVADPDMAVVYLSLSDGTGGRISESTELLHLDAGAIGQAWGPQVDYDAASGTAIYRLEIQGFQKDLIGKDVRLTLHSILLGTEWRPPADIGLSLADVLAANPAPETFTYNAFENPADDGPVHTSYGISYGADPAVGERLAARFEAGALPFLAPDSAPLPTGANSWVNITAAGVVDGMLHLQYRPASEAAEYAITSLELWWPGIDIADGYAYSGLNSGSFNLGESRMEGGRDYYEAYEVVLELPEGVPPEDIRITIGGQTAEARLAGPWTVDFTLECGAAALTADVDIAAQGWNIRRITVSAIGMQLDGVDSGSPGGAGSTEHAVYLKDGTQVKSDSASTYSDSEGQMGMRENFARPIDIAEVDRVVIDGHAVFFNR